jgi:ferrous iron transport protein A
MSEQEELGVVLAASGWPPLDWIEAHAEAWEHLEAEEEHISAQAQDWLRTPGADPFVAATELLAQDVRHQGNYRVVEVGYNRHARPSLEEAIERAIRRGSRRVVVVPTQFTCGSVPVELDLPRKIAAIQEQYPDVEIVYAGPPFDRQRQAGLIVNQVERHTTAPLPEPAGVRRLHALKPGETGVITDLLGGHELVSRLAALGFTPGAPVTMVQNYGHGPIIVTIRDTRIALGRGEAGKVRVKAESGRQKNEG